VERSRECRGFELGKSDRGQMGGRASWVYHRGEKGVGDSAFSAQKGLNYRKRGRGEGDADRDPFLSKRIKTIIRKRSSFGGVGAVIAEGRRTKWERLKTELL